MDPVISAIIFVRAQLSTAHKPGIFIIYRPITGQMVTFNYKLPHLEPDYGGLELYHLAFPNLTYLQRPELQETVIAEDLITSDLPAVTGDETLDVVAQIMSAKGVVEIPVVDSSDPKRLLGSLSEQDGLCVSFLKSVNR